MTAILFNLWLRSKLKVEYVSEGTLIILLFFNYILNCVIIMHVRIVNCNNLYIILSYYHVPSEKLFSNILCLSTMLYT